jgi:hypothetical protein
MSTISMGSAKKPSSPFGSAWLLFTVMCICGLLVLGLVRFVRGCEFSSPFAKSSDVDTETEGNMLDFTRYYTEPEYKTSIWLRCVAGYEFVTYDSPRGVAMVQVIGGSGAGVRCQGPSD